MSVTLNRVNTFFKLPLQDIDIARDSKMEINSRIKSLTPTACADLVLSHAKINLEYNVLCSKLACEFANREQSEFKEQLEAALKTAELLEIIYNVYLDSPREYHRVQRDQAAFRRELQAETEASRAPVAESTETSRLIREGTPNFNLPRLFALRVRRLLLAIVPLTSEFSVYHDVMQTTEQWTTPAFMYASWLIFLPRLANNIAMIIKHTVEHPYMSEEEKSLGWENRLWMQLMARFSNISNDLPWFIANLVGCFVLTGTLAPYGIILSICMQFYEVIQSVTVYMIELNQLHQQRDDYVMLLDQTDENSSDYNDIQSYIDHLELRINFESNRQWIPVQNAIILFFAMILAAPIFAFSPWIAIAGGLIAVATTINAYLEQQFIEQERPRADLFAQLKSGTEVPPESASAVTTSTTATATATATTTAPLSIKRLSSNEFSLFESLRRTSSYGLSPEGAQSTRNEVQTSRDEIIPTPSN